MAIPESQLETWSKQGSINQSSSTYASVKKAVIIRQQNAFGKENISEGNKAIKIKPSQSRRCQVPRFSCQREINIKLTHEYKIELCHNHHERYR